MNNKGFTLIEVLAIIAILGMLLTIVGYSVTGLIKSSREESLEIFKGNVKSGLINYYNECKYMPTQVCVDAKIEDNTLTTKLFDLSINNFLDVNNEGSSDDFKIKNPVTEEDITDCIVSITYNSGDKKFDDVVFENDACGSLKNR